MALWATWPRSRSIGYGVHAYLVRGVMIDTGFPGIGPAMRDLLTSVPLRGAMLTHHHEDHAGNVNLLVDAGVPVAMDAATHARVREPGRIGVYRHFTWKSMKPMRAAITPFTDDDLLLVPTPGHCSNHHAIWDAQTGTCFTGDLYLGVKVRIAHSYENPYAQVQSLRDIIAKNPARVFCSHRGFIENGVSMLQAKTDWLQELIGRAEHRFDEGRSDDEIRQELLGKLGSTHYFSFGDYSPRNLITAIRNARQMAVTTDGSAVRLFAPRAHR